jgi:signal transduction histidine kinase
MGETEYLLIIIVFNFFLLAFILAAIMFVVQYKNKKRENQAKLEQQQILHQKEILSTEVEIQFQTMQHIGREIHDNVGQQLTLASLYTQHLAYENKAPEINERIKNISEIINESLAELRHLSKSLTDNTIKNANVKDLLIREFAKIEGLKKYKLNLVINLEGLILSYQAKSVIVRVTQEFLQNSMKYADCKTLGINASVVNGRLKIVLTDDGVGFDVSDTKDSGIGLVNMEKRIELIGGSYLLESKKDVGTKLTIEISLLS